MGGKVSVPLMFRLLCLVLLGVLADASSPARAANISAPGLHAEAVKADENVSAYWPTDPVKCDVVLDGEILDGDAATLEREFATIPGTWNSFTFFFCLRSPGGSVSEALRIAKFVRNTQRPSIATVVEDGQTCASACALIFLAGNAPARVGAWPQRFLHPRGRLLYHSSRLELGRFSDDALLAHLTTPTNDGLGLKSKIAGLYQDGLRDVQSVLSTFQGFTFQRDTIGAPWVRPSLFLEMFAQDPNEWICIDSVDTVGRWNIQVYGYRPPVAPAKTQHLNVCHNTFNWRADEFAATAINENTDTNFEIKTPPQKTKIAGRNKESHGFDTRLVLPYQSIWAQTSCVIEVKYFQSKQIDVATELAVFFMNSDGERITEMSGTYPTSFFPATTLLPDLPGVRPPVRPAAGTQAERSFRRSSNSLINGCSYKSISKAGLEECQAACSADRGCKAYSYNKLTRACDLKHTLSALRLDPLWVSGTPSTGPAAERSSRAVAMVAYERASDQRLDGEVIDTVPAADEATCAQRCEVDRSCLAIEHDSSNEQCQRFSTVTGLKASAGGTLASAQIKRQK
jgi:hypothetical protein